MSNVSHENDAQPASPAKTPEMSMRPVKRRQFLMTLVAVYPVITLILYGVLPLTRGWQIWQTTLIVAPVMVAVMVFWLIPAIQKYFGRFIMQPRP